MQQFFQFAALPTPVLRLGLATRGNTHLLKDDLLLALEQGVNYWNWCGYLDGMGEAIQQLGPRRKDIVVAVQLEAREGTAAQRELETRLKQLKTDYLDVVTFYYVESSQEWRQLLAPGGALKALQNAKQQGLLRMMGLTTHQRALAAEVLRSRLLDLLMVRYNAAHRGAETEIFPLAHELRSPLVTFTALRWKGLLKRTREDPRGFIPPGAREWYRFVLSRPEVSVVLMAPNDRTELVENLRLLRDWRKPGAEELALLREHGDRVRKRAGAFP